MRVIDQRVKPETGLTRDRILSGKVYMTLHDAQAPQFHMKLEHSSFPASLTHRVVFLLNLGSGNVWQAEASSRFIEVDADLVVKGASC